MTAPAGKGAFVSPMTTMVQSKIDANPALSVDDAEDLVKGNIGFDVDSTVSLFEDYIFAKADTSNADADNYETIHNISRVTAKVIAENFELVTESAEATNTDFNILVQVIVQAVIAELDTITESVETAAADGTFDETEVTTVSEDTSTVDTTTLDETIAQQEIEASGTATTSLLDAFVNGLSWFWTEFPDADYGTITSDANGLMSEAEFYFDGTNFVADSGAAEPDNDMVLTATGWGSENDTLNGAQAAEANGELTVVKSDGSPAFVISAITTTNISGKKISDFLSLVKSLDPEEGWSPKNVSPDSVFSSGAESSKVLFKEPETYGIGYWNDGICIVFTLGTGTNCNVETDQQGAALTVLTDVIGTMRYLGDDLAYTLQGTSTDTTGTVTFERPSGTGTALPTSNWSLVTINTEQLIEFVIPPVVRPLTWDVEPPKHS